MGQTSFILIYNSIFQSGLLKL